jgi:hypothetical protein
MDVLAWSVVHGFLISDAGTITERFHDTVGSPDVGTFLTDVQPAVVSTAAARRMLVFGSMSEAERKRFDVIAHGPV